MRRSTIRQVTQFRGCVLAVLSGVCLGQTAQQGPRPPQPPPLPGSLQTHAAWPAAQNAGDVDSVEHIMAALYDVISGPAGKARDWDRFRSLFLPDGRLAVVRAQAPAADGRPAREGDVAFLTPDAYAERETPFFQAESFFERGVANRVEQFGNLTSVWSTYESRHAPGAQPFARGINAVQLAYARGRYWIVSLVWDSERPGVTLPEKYLP